jgi:hypothetical protein
LNPSRRPGRGGLVADLVSWCAGFFINVPIGVLLIWEARRYIAETPRRSGRFDGVIATSLVGLVLLGQIHPGSPFVFGVAVPMMLVGAGMGASLALLTISGVAGVACEDAGSASGLIGVAHQPGGALGLAVLVVVFASTNVLAGAAATIELAH